ncbi:MAG TPA: type II toxin-antitoxin system RelE/ParE family toxin [Candidatus Paceibacterota bacterium]|nr:type II toxin-antitoxin system RelE/ParE family toxin [Candidatus Paceibacterota bacterium]
MGEKESYSLKYDSHFDRDLDRLGRFWQREVLLAIEYKLSVQPELYGIPLRRTLKGFRKLRIGDYRVIYQIEKKTIKIVIVGHRSEVYKEVLKRLGV